MKTYQFLSIEETQVGVIDEDGKQRVQTSPDQVPEGETILPYDGPTALDEWRDSKSIPKDEFLANCADLGLLTDQEAIDGARGIWPTSFDGALADKPVKEARNSKMRFAAAVNISRNHPDIEDLRLFADLTPEQVDGLFQ